MTDNERIADLHCELRKKDNCINELEEEMRIKDEILRKQVIMLHEKDERMAEYKKNHTRAIENYQATVRAKNEKIKALNIELQNSYREIKSLKKTIHRYESKQ